MHVYDDTSVLFEKITNDAHEQKWVQGFIDIENAQVSPLESFDEKKLLLYNTLGQVLGTSSATLQNASASGSSMMNLDLDTLRYE